MKWIKSAVIGVLGSLVMFLLMMYAIHGAGIAPFNLPPSAAFLEQLGLNVGPLLLLVHFGYGATWSVLLVWLYGADTSVRRGVFSFGGAGYESGDLFHLGPPVKYIGATLVLHLIYGFIIGGLNPAWIQFESRQAAA